MSGWWRNQNFLPVTRLGKRHNSNDAVSSIIIIYCPTWQCKIMVMLPFKVMQILHRFTSKPNIYLSCCCQIMKYFLPIFVKHDSSYNWLVTQVTVYFLSLVCTFQYTKEMYGCCTEHKFTEPSVRMSFPVGGHCRHFTNLVWPVTCSAILAVLDKDDDLGARHELLNTERIF